MIIIEPQRDELLMRINHKIKLVLLFVKKPIPWRLKGEGTHQAQTQFYLQQDIGSIYYSGTVDCINTRTFCFILYNQIISPVFHCQSVYPPDDLKYLHSNSTKQLILHYFVKVKYIRKLDNVVYNDRVHRAAQTISNNSAVKV